MLAPAKSASQRYREKKASGGVVKQYASPEQLAQWSQLPLVVQKELGVYDRVRKWESRQAKKVAAAAQVASTVGIGTLVVNAQPVMAATASSPQPTTPSVPPLVPLATQSDPMGASMPLVNPSPPAIALPISQPLPLDFPLEEQMDFSQLEPEHVPTSDDLPIDCPDEPLAPPSSPVALPSVESKANDREVIDLVEEADVAPIVPRGVPSGRRKKRVVGRILIDQ